jgi:DNA-binding NtrC family response regulator
LRERPEDIEPLINYYIEQYASQLGGNDIAPPSPSIISKLTTYHWPGNVRELQNVLKRMLVLGNADKIVAELFETGPSDHVAAASHVSAGADTSINAIIDLDSDDPLKNNNFSLKAVKKKAVDKVEKEVISYILEKTDWNRSKASKILKVSYKTLLNKISELGIGPPSES